MESRHKKVTVTKTAKVNPKNNCVLLLKTPQTAAFKQAIERISNFISDCCIVFIRPDQTADSDSDDDYYEEVDESPRENTKNKKKNSSHNEEEVKNKPKNNKRNTGGIRIIRLTEDRSILVKLILEAVNFEYFRCDIPKITIGVDMNQFHLLLKSIDDSNPIEIYMTQDNMNILRIRSVNETKESNEKTEIKLSLIEISNPDVPIQQTEFQNKIAMSSEKFHTICKQLSGNSTHVEIASQNDEIIFRCKSESGEITKTYKDPNYPDKSESETNIVQGIYEIRSLMIFGKCTKLCNFFEIYFKNNFPLVFVIPVATLGKMYAFFSPIENFNN